MLLIYDLTTGEILDNTGTNSGMPEGPEDESAIYVNVDNRGIPRDSVGLLRLHDEEDADLVAQVMGNLAHVENGAVVIDGPRPVETLLADPPRIPADGSVVSNVTYRNTQAGAPTEVTFDVNGLKATEPLVSGAATIEVVGSTVGEIVVHAGIHTTRIEVF